jgi:NAD(P)H-hydrate epimerase
MRAMSCQEVRDVDRRAVEDFHMPSIVLMENAGRGAADLLERLGIAGPVVVCAGRGNNAGDGFVIARHLEIRGHSVRVLLFCAPERLKGDALTNYRILDAAGAAIVDSSGEMAQDSMLRELQAADWIIDALLGTGIRGEVRDPYASAIRTINSAGRKVLAVDLPSGMDCDTGKPLGACVRADHTATFVAPKRGFDAPGAPELTGTVHVLDIGVPRAALRS